MFENFDWTTALLIFIAYLVIDIGSTWVTIAIQKLQVGLATTLTFFLYLGSAWGIIEYTHNPAYVLFMATGASLGGFIMLTIEKRRQKKSPHRKNL